MDDDNHPSQGFPGRGIRRAFPDCYATPSVNNIYRAIFMSGAAHLYFGVYQPDEEKLKKLDGMLAGYKHSLASTIDYTFFDSGSARVWDA